jgi:hypothetical protein
MYRFLRSMLQLLDIANFIYSTFTLSTLMMEAIRSSETSVSTSATLRHMTEDVILHSHRRVTMKSYIVLTGWAL